MLLTRKINDKMEYVQRDVHDNFGTMSRDAKLGVGVVVLAANPSNSRPIIAVQGDDSTSKAVRFNKGRDLEFRSERMGVASALKILDIGLPKSKLEIHNAKSTDGFNSNLIEL